jgi:5-methylcytosine-specific restriction protein B
MITTDWHSELKNWRIENSKTIMPELKAIQKEFVERFPKEKLPQLKLEEYALGTEDSKNTFCYWLEQKTEPLGSIKGGSAVKFGVYFSPKDHEWHFNKVYSSAEDAIEQIRQGIYMLIQAAEEERYDEIDEIGIRYLGPNRYSLRSKPLSLYFPEKFLPINSHLHLEHFCSILGLKSQKSGFIAKNRELLEFLQQQSEFEGFDTHQLMKFMYDRFNPNIPRDNIFEDFLKQFVEYSKTENYRKEERDYKERLMTSMGKACLNH